MIEFDYKKIKNSFIDKKNKYYEDLGEKKSIENNIKRLEENLKKINNESEDLILVDTLLKEILAAMEELDEKCIYPVHPRNL